MRLSMIISVLLSLQGCDQLLPPTVDRIEIWAPGLEIQFDTQGHGLFTNKFTKQRKRFSLTKDRLHEVQARLQPFLRAAKIASEQQLVKEFNAPCNGSYVTDSGGINIHWSGPSFDRWYLVDYGCDPERNAARNHELQAIVRRLPVPEPSLWP